MSVPQSLTLGTRRSNLARLQTTLVHQTLVATFPSLIVHEHATDALADRDKTTALYAMGDKALWTGELEELLAAGRIHAIVHSLKDVPTALPQGMELAATLARENPWDAVILPKGEGVGQTAHQIFAGLSDGSIVGTSSLRRTAQLRRAYPHLRFEICRGNIETRLAKLDSPENFPNQDVKYDAIILAAAGLIRAGLDERITAYLDGTENGGSCLYAVGQGAIGIEIRSDDEEIRNAIKAISHVPTYRATTAERSLLRTLEGGCSVPIGVQTSWEGKTLKLKGVVVSVDGKESVDAEATAQVETDEAAVELGKTVASQLIQGGAGKILEVINADKKKAQDEVKAKVGDAKAFVEQQSA